MSHQVTVIATGKGIPTSTHSKKIIKKKQKKKEHTGPFHLLNQNFYTTEATGLAHTDAEV